MNQLVLVLFGCGEIARVPPLGLTCPVVTLQFANQSTGHREATFN